MSVPGNTEPPPHGVPQPLVFAALIAVAVALGATTEGATYLAAEASGLHDERIALVWADGPPGLQFADVCPNMSRPGASDDAASLGPNIRELEGVVGASTPTLESAHSYTSKRQLAVAHISRGVTAWSGTVAWFAGIGALLCAAHGVGCRIGIVREGALLSANAAAAFGSVAVPIAMSVWYGLGAPPIVIWYFVATSVVGASAAIVAPVVVPNDGVDRAVRLGLLALGCSLVGTIGYFGWKGEEHAYHRNMKHDTVASMLTAAAPMSLVDMCCPAVAVPPTPASAPSVSTVDPTKASFVWRGDGTFEGSFPTVSAPVAASSTPTPSCSATDPKFCQLVRCAYDRKAAEAKKKPAE